MMTIGTHAHPRCRICFSWIQRDRSLACQKSYHLFKHVERRKFQLKNPLPPNRAHVRSPTVCFGDLIDRYLHVRIAPIRNSSNLICSDCSLVLLDIEQYAKYLRKTIQQLKAKLNKSNQLRTSSLSVRLQKKKRGEAIPKEESDEEFDDVDDEEEFNDEQDESKSSPRKSNFQLPSPSSSDGESSSPRKPPISANDPCNNNDEDGLIKSSPKSSFSPASNGLITTSNLLEEASNSNLFQMHLAQLMSSTINPHQQYSHANHNQSIMNTFANLQRNLFLQLLNDPTSAGQAAGSSTPLKMNLTSANNKQMSSGRKRKSTPEKRTITNSNGDASPTREQESADPLELTMKNSHFNNRVQTSSSPDIQNIVTNGSPSDYPMFDETKESLTLNDSSLSPSLIRRPTPSKRTKLSASDQPQKLKIHISPTTPTSTHLLSPNQQINSADDHQQQKQQKKIDPRPCAECGKILFSDKTHLLHCQTHAKNEKQCWICGIQDEDVKKHILNEHGNQKFTNAGFKCQHCERIFPVYADLQTHMREHNKKKPFECPICNKRFGQQGNLSCHLRIHSGVKPFTCAHCGKAFRHSNSLRRHARTVHSASRVLPSNSGSGTPLTSGLLATTSNSMVSMANDYPHGAESYDDNHSGLMIASDDGESLQSTNDPPSPSLSNAPMDSDSPEQYGTN